MIFIFVIKIRRVLDLLLCPCRRIDLTILLLYKQFYMLYIVFSFYNYLNAHLWNNLIIIRERKGKIGMWQGLGFWQILGPGSQYQPGLEVLPQARACAATWEPVVPGRNGPATRGGGLQSRLGSTGWTPGTRGPYGRELVALFPLVIHLVPPLAQYFSAVLNSIKIINKFTRCRKQHKHKVKQHMVSKLTLLFSPLIFSVPTHRKACVSLIKLCLIQREHQTP